MPEAKNRSRHRQKTELNDSHFHRRPAFVGERQTRRLQLHTQISEWVRSWYMTEEVRKQTLTIPRTTTMKTPPSLPRSIWALPLAAAPGHGSPCFFTHLRLVISILNIKTISLDTYHFFLSFLRVPCSWSFNTPAEIARVYGESENCQNLIWFEDNDYNEHNEEAAMCDTFHLPSKGKLK